jgi:hypothetical protein
VNLTIDIYEFDPLSLYFWVAEVIMKLASDLKVSLEKNQFPKENKRLILLGSSYTGRAKDFPKFSKTGNALNKMELETIKKGI